MRLTALWIAVLPLGGFCSADAAFLQHKGRTLRRLDDVYKSLPQDGDMMDTLPEDGGYWERLLENEAGSINDGEIPEIPGMVIVPSLYPLNETSDNLRAAFDAAPENEFAAISHSNFAASVGLTLEPNNLIIFGDPKLGIPIMQENQKAGLDLPQKLLVWEKNNQVYVGYNSVNYLKFRYDGIENAPTLDQIAGVLLNFASVATGVPINEIHVGDSIDLDSTGIMTETSDADFETTYTRLFDAIDQSPADIAFEVFHSFNATLPPTRLIVFGNPVIGTPLMQVSPTAGIDLPLKMLVWEDDNGDVHVTANDVDYLASRHDIQGVDATLDQIKMIIKNFMTVATVS